MAKATGYICDSCEKFETTDDNRAPMGWLRLTVRTHSPTDEGWDLCSDACVKKHANERIKAHRGTSNGATQSSSDSDGLLRVAGVVDQFIRTRAVHGALRQPWWGTYAEGYEQASGKGYSWVVAFEEDEQAAFADFLADVVNHIKSQERPQTDTERRVIATVANNILPALVAA